MPISAAFVDESDMGAHSMEQETTSTEVRPEQGTTRADDGSHCLHGMRASVMANRLLLYLARRELT